MSSEPAGLYIHVPFCSAICPYCDFAVLVGRREKRQRFVETLLLEIAMHAGTVAGIDTIYFGGGTPSLLEPADLERLLIAIREAFTPGPGTRIYLEANPEDVDPARLESWRRLGVNTLGLGVQSFGIHFRTQSKAKRSRLLGLVFQLGNRGCEGDHLAEFQFAACSFSKGCVACVEHGDVWGLSLDSGVDSDSGLKVLVKPDDGTRPFHELGTLGSGSLAHRRAEELLQGPQARTNRGQRGGMCRYAGGGEDGV